MQTLEEAMEEIIRSGYLIDTVKILMPVDCCSNEQWVPIEEVEDLPDETWALLIGKNARGATARWLPWCEDLPWLKDWWIGGWQANI